MKTGFRVPDGFVVTTNGYDEMLTKQALGPVISESLAQIDYARPETIDACSEKIRNSIQRATIPPDLISEVKTYYGQIGEGNVAIRSSASAEDLPEASFAGQYDTYLNVQGTNDVLEHIKQCFASLWSSRAIAYRQKNRIPHEKVRIAVIVQSMVEPRSAGVLFTKNPTPSAGCDMVIESSFGLGESVVSGEVNPDRFLVSQRTTGGKQEYSVVAKEIGAKGASGASLVASQRPSLTDVEVAHLAEIGSSVESVFHSPQDIEWAIDESGEVYVLQTRPITTRKAAKKELPQDIVWSRGYSDDYWNDNVSPLFYDLLGDQLTYIVNNELNQIMGYKKMDPRLLKLFKAHVYFNLDILRNKVVYEIPPFLRSEDVLNYFPEGSGPYGKRTMKSLPFKLKNRILAEIRVTLLDGNGSMTKTATVYKNWTKDQFDVFCKEFDQRFAQLEKEGSPESLMELVKELDKTMMAHFRLVRYGIPVHNIGMNLASNYLLRRFLGADFGGKAFPALISGLDHKTTETNRRISELAELAVSLPSVRRVIVEKPSSQTLPALKSMSGSEPQRFIDTFDKFINDFGDRGFTREPYYPRWSEAPERVFDVLKSLVTYGIRDMTATGARTLRLRGRVEKEVERRMRRQRNGSIKWLLFSTILSFARTYIVFREDQRFNLDRWITRNRRAYLAIGKRLTAQGALRDPSRIFFLHRKEIKQLIYGKPDEPTKRSFSQLAEQRYKEFTQNEDVAPPKFICESREYDDAVPEPSSILQGIAASQGQATGTVRVLNSIQEISQVKSEEILVVPRTDPGWTPVFSSIRALITETGGILSHGAVVSREYGIPAVTNVRDVCRTLKTGQIVTVDGNLGQVLLRE
jgi:pyruvate,water dikinase